MLDAKIVLQRIKDCYGFRTDEDIAAFLKLAPGTIASWKNRNYVDTHLLIEKCKNISLEWLFRDRGPAEWDSFFESLTDLTKLKYVPVPVYDMLGAGNLAALTGTKPIATTLIPQDFHRVGIWYFKVVGDSLFPFVRRGAYVGVDVEDKKIFSGEIYAVNFHPEGAALKFLQSTGKSVIFYSANREIYRDVEVSNEELLDEHSGVKIIGRLRFLQQVY